jgi:hypothetical protein
MSNNRYYINLPKPDKDGNQIIFHGLCDTNSSHYLFSDAVKLLLMTIDASLYNVGCVNGHIFLFDMRGVKITHLTRLSLLGIRKFFEYIQEGMPVRLKAIHVLNCVWFIDKVLALLKPFMKKELMDIVSLKSKYLHCALYITFNIIINLKYKYFKFALIRGKLQYYSTHNFNFSFKLRFIPKY